jgi:hypothetical protein
MAMMAETQMGAAYLSCLDASQTMPAARCTTTNFCRRSLAWACSREVVDSAEIGAPDTIRTCGLHLRRVALYPAELRLRNAYADFLRYEEMTTDLASP